MTKNLGIEYFKLSDRSHFKSNKKALMHHNLDCENEFCQVCMFFNKTKGFTFKENNLLPYEIGFSNLRDTKIKKQWCKIQFSRNITVKNEEEQQMLRVNWAQIQLANYFCTSLGKQIKLKYTLSKVTLTNLL